MNFQRSNLNKIATLSRLGTNLTILNLLLVSLLLSVAHTQDISTLNINANLTNCKTKNNIGIGVVYCSEGYYIFRNGDYGNYWKAG